MKKHMALASSIIMLTPLSSTLASNSNQKIGINLGIGYSYSFIDESAFTNNSILSETWNNNGGKLFMIYCQQCHSLQRNDFGGYPGGGNIPDLTYSKASIFDMFDNIVLDGIFLQKGMPSFSDRLNKEQTKKIKEYIISMANKSKS